MKFILSIFLEAIAPLCYKYETGRYRRGCRHFGMPRLKLPMHLPRVAFVSEQITTWLLMPVIQKVDKRLYTSASVDPL